MNDEQLDKILKKALTPQREIKEEEIVLKKRRKEEKMMRKKRMKMAGIAGTVAAALALRKHRSSSVCTIPTPKSPIHPTVCVGAAMVLTCCKKRLPPWWAWRNGSIRI